MANSPIGMQGHAFFSDAAALGYAPETGLDPASAAQRSHPSLNKEAPWSVHTKLDSRNSWRVEEIDGAPHLMARPVIMSKSHDCGGDAGYVAETDRLRAIGRANAEFWALQAGRT